MPYGLFPGTALIAFPRTPGSHQATQSDVQSLSLTFCLPFLMKVSVTALFSSYFFCWFAVMMVSLEFAPRIVTVCMTHIRVNSCGPLLQVSLGRRKRRKRLSYLTWLLSNCWNCLLTWIFGSLDCKLYEGRQNTCVVHLCHPTRSKVSGT